MKVSVLFCILCYGHRSHLWTHPTRNTSLYVVLAKVSLFGVRKMNLKFDPLFPKKRKNWDFKLAVNWKLYSRPNSKTVSHIQFKLGTGIDHTSGITRHDFKSKGQRSRSQHHVTYPVKIAITQYWVDVSSLYLEANMRTTPKRVGHKMVVTATTVA